MAPRITGIGHNLTFEAVVLRRVEWKETPQWISWGGKYLVALSSGHLLPWTASPGGDFLALEGAQ